MSHYPEHYIHRINQASYTPAGRHLSKTCLPEAKLHRILYPTHPPTSIYPIHKEKTRAHSRFSQLLLTEPTEKPNAYNKLHAQRNPKPTITKPMQAHSEIRKDSTRPIPIRSASSRDNRSQGSQNLGADQSKRDMEPRQRLQKNHTKANTLYRIENTEPKPQRPSNKSTSDGRSSPRNPLPHA